MMEEFSQKRQASITNWVSGETNVGAVESARLVLDKVKRQRYGHSTNKYRLVKVSDHPLTFREELIEGSNLVALNHTPVVEDDAPLEEVDFGVLAVKEVADEGGVDECEVIDAEVDPFPVQGLYPGEVKINANTGA
jgi:hypothetical protein